FVEGRKEQFVHRNSIAPLTKWQSFGVLRKQFAHRAHDRQIIRHGITFSEEKNVDKVFHINISNIAWYMRIRCSFSPLSRRKRTKKRNSFEVLGIPHSAECGSGLRPDTSQTF
ncbi:MAG: hypothetical protein II768_08245, partial [Clostridia bacterium]|nr:hypothetical protein [Clostridia bacterium]